MKSALVLISILLLSSCATKLSKVQDFVELSRSQKAPQNFVQSAWNFEAIHDDEDFSYSFTGLFLDEIFNYETCLWLPKDGTWKVLEIPTYKTKDNNQTDIAAAYKLEGSYLEIYIPSNLCDHSYEILKTNISSGEIHGYLTIDASYWGHYKITGKVEAYKVTNPNKVKNENAASGTDAQKTARPF